MGSEGVSQQGWVGAGSRVLAGSKAIAGVVENWRRREGRAVAAYADRAALIVRCP